MRNKPEKQKYGRYGLASCLKPPFWHRCAQFLIANFHQRPQNSKRRGKISSPTTLLTVSFSLWVEGRCIHENRITETVKVLNTVWVKLTFKPRLLVMLCAKTTTCGRQREWDSTTETNIKMLKADKICVTYALCLVLGPLVVNHADGLITVNLLLIWISSIFPESRKWIHIE